MKRGLYFLLIAFALPVNAIDVDFQAIEENCLSSFKDKREDGILYCREKANLEVEKELDFVYDKTVADVRKKFGEDAVKQFTDSHDYWVGYKQLTCDLNALISTLEYGECILNFNVTRVNDIIEFNNRLKSGNK